MHVVEIAGWKHLNAAQTAKSPGAPEVSSHVARWRPRRADEARALGVVARILAVEATQTARPGQGAAEPAGRLVAHLLPRLRGSDEHVLASHRQGHDLLLAGALEVEHAGPAVRGRL